MYRLIIAAVILFSVSTTVLAQGRVGSPYTRYGIGDVTTSTLTRNNSMGGVSYTLPYNNGINYINPAAVADIDTLTFIFDFGLNGGVRMYSIDEPSSSQSKSDIHLSHMNFGFAVTKWWKAAVGVSPFSDVGYSIVSNDTSLNVDKNYLFAGDGGVTKVFLTNAFSPFKDFEIGVTASYIFGKIYQSNAIVFNDDTGAYLNVFEQNEIRVNDFTFDAGIKYDFEVNDKNSLTIGAVYGYNPQLNATRSSIVYNTLSTGGTAITDTVFYADDEVGKIGLPQKIGLGIGYNYDNKLYLGIDYSMQDWKGAQFFGEIDELNNGSFLSFGGEYVPAGRQKSAFKYWQAVSYRGGVHFNQNYMNLSTGQTPINDFGISFGLGLPMKHSKTSFNVSLELGQRGSLDNGLVKENYAIIGLNFNLAEMWFVKRKFD